MKFSLTMPFVKALTIEQKPVGIDQAGSVIYESNPSRKDYIVWDVAQDAPPGFGVKVARKKTFIVRRKFDGKSIMPTVGNVADYMGEKSPLTTARADAASLVLKMRETGRNPNVDARKRSAKELTLGQILFEYRTHLVTRTERPAQRETLKAHNTDMKKFQSYGWFARKLIDISLEEIQECFRDERERAPSANERAFNFVITAVNWCIRQEQLRAVVEKRLPLLVANPFDILRLNKMFRTREQLEAMRQVLGKRNPLTPSKTFGTFLEAAWSRKNINDNRTGVDYLICQLLLGCRGSEHGPCQWGELLTIEERLVTSHFMLEPDDREPYAFFYGTKNHKSHKLPLGPMLVELLRRRRMACADEEMRRNGARKGRKFAFPARSKFSKTGHYSDPTALLQTLREEAEIKALTGHDLRRSFGSMMENLDVPQGVRRRFFNHAEPDVTALYTSSEWKMLREWIERIEQNIFATAPNVFNSLKPAQHPMMAAQPPHVCKAPKPRTGRPRTASLAVSVVSIA